MMTQFDRRLHPVRSDLASIEYKGRVHAEKFVEGNAMSIAADKVELRPKPDLRSGIDTELNFGETFTVYDQSVDGWSWGQLATDGYVGWLPTSALGEHIEPTHRVKTLRTYRYPDAEMKRSPLGLLSIGSVVCVVAYETTRDLKFAKLEDGSYVVAGHLSALDKTVVDWVETAQSLLGTPYLWGGRSSLGLDCSGLIQLAAQSGGIVMPRDADMQEKEVGTALDLSRGLPALQRGDLMFWKGHVGVMTDSVTLLHANGHTMTVAYENIYDALERIGKHEFGQLSSVKRL